jgi:hypothetical protein
MAQKKMTLHEELTILAQSYALDSAGKKEEGMALVKANIPMPAWLAKIYKEKIGVDYLRNSGWDLSEAEEAYGHGWLSR